MEVGLVVGGAFLSSALNVFFDRMTPKFSSLFWGRKRDEQLLKKLKTTLLTIQAVLDDAEDKQTRDMLVKEWLCELKNIVYYAEDLVDEIKTEALRLEVEGGEKSATNMVSHFSDEFLKEIIPKIEEVVSSLKDFESQIRVLHLERVVMKKDKSNRLPSTSLVDESDVYGRDNEREKLVKVVLSDNINGNNVGVIPIIGMGGLGKTTLAQLVYGDERVNKHFDIRAWVCVSENYDALKITKTLVRKVTHLGAEDKDDFDMLQVKLKESLTEKKFLIVLDDVWNDNYNDWDKLKAPLKYGKKGSKIIVTTRNEKVALTMQNEPMHHLKGISDEDCWSLFKKHAFSNGGPLASPDFEKIGKEIVNKCDGLPLAIKTLGGFLRSKIVVKEWDDILRGGFWILGNNQNDVLPVLKLSYHNLPPYLKHCFAFCAVFPKKYHFDEEELILLWMANDLLQHPTQNGKTIEDIGFEYFSELRSRFFFQKVSDNKYLMHDLVNDLAQHVCGKFYVGSEDYHYGEIPSEARYFSYMSEYNDTFRKFKFLAHVNNLRTFFPINSGSRLNKMFLTDILPLLVRLRVLSLCGYHIYKLPDSICKFKQLHYINLSRTNIRQLPDSICSLYNLQTLLLSWCEYLHKLPLDLTKLVNLRHLNLKGTKLMEMPSHMSRLKSLQTLSCFIVGKSPSENIKELGKLHLHGYLKIMGLQNVINFNHALKANLRNKNRLEDLVLQWSRDTNDPHIAKGKLDKLIPHTNLKSLTIDGYGGTSFSHWLGHDSFCNIVSLCLTNCMNCDSLPALGHLASLKSLSISRLDSIRKIGEEFYGDNSSIKPFQSLVTLKIEHMSKWEEWDTLGNVGFSCLEEFYVKDCAKLVGELPSQLLLLKTFEISGCPKLVIPIDWMTIPQDNQVRLHSSLQVVKMYDMPNLKEIPEGLLKLGLEQLRVETCHGLITFPKVMTHVNKMIVCDCPSLVSLPIVSPSANIKELNISECRELEFPTGDGCFSSVEHLRVKNAGDSFNDFSLSLFPKLLTLEILRCETLKVFPASCTIQNLRLLRRLYFWDCNNLLSFPQGGLPAPNLEYFRVSSCMKLKSLPEQMHSLLPSLRDLSIVNCPEIESFPEGGLPSSLKSLWIKSCQKLMTCRGDWNLQRLSALREFKISDDDEESFPDEWLLPCTLRDLEIEHHKNLKTLNQKGVLGLTSLQTLYIYNCPELQSLPEEGLPTSLKTLKISNCLELQSLPDEGLPTSLETLRIVNCPKLQSLPEEGLPTFVSELEVKHCPSLAPLLERERGKYWPNIAHIPLILLDDELIS